VRIGLAGEPAQAEREVVGRGEVAAETEMNVKGWHEGPIGGRHDRETFDRGEIAWNEFLQRHARKTHEMGGAKTFPAINDADDTTIPGYYSLSHASTAYTRTPKLVRRSLARHNVPAFRLSRLAVDLSVQGHRLGGQLLLSAGKRCLLASAEVGGVAVRIDATSARPAAWHASYGAVPLLDAPLSLLLPLATVGAGLKTAGK
jgi:hypothetical protein